MDLVTVVQILQRRWMVFGGGVLVTIATAAILASFDLSTYSSEGTVVVVRGPGAAATEGVDGADPALQQTARLLGEVVSSAAGASGDGDLAVTTDAELPILRVTATDAEGPTAVDAVTTVTEQMQTQLDELAQSGDVAIPDGTTIRQLVPPTDAEAVTTDDGALQFTSTATLLLTRDEQGPDSAANVSGLIDPSDSVEFVAGILFERFGDDAVQDEMSDDGATGITTLEYEDTSPVIHVLAQADDPDVALQTGQVAVETLQRIASDIQAADDIPEDLRFRVEALSYPLYPSVFENARMRTVLGVLALGLLASVGLALMVDAAVTRRIAGVAPKGPPRSGRRMGGRRSDEPWSLWATDPDGSSLPDDDDVSRTSAPPER